MVFPFSNAMNKYWMLRKNYQSIHFSFQRCLNPVCYLILHLDYVHLFFVSFLLVMGSIQWPLLTLDIYGALRANGQSYVGATRNINGTLIGGLGGGSGGTILLFLQTLELAENSSLSAVGGNGGLFGGGGGGGGRVHFHWSKIDVGDEYVPVAMISGAIDSRYVYHNTHINVYPVFEHGPVQIL